MENQIPTVPDNSSVESSDLMQVAKFQKYLLITLLISLANIVLLRNFYLSFIISIGAIYFTYEICSALKMSLKWLWMVGMLIPILNMILLLIINSKATKFIRAAGFRVGILGADLKDIRSKFNSGPSTPPAV